MAKQIKIKNDDINSVEEQNTLILLSDDLTKEDTTKKDTTKEEILKEDTINNTITLENLSIFELNQLEKAVQTICIKYEKLSHMNMGSYDERSQKEMLQATNVLTKYHEKYEKVINEIQKRIDNIL